MALLDDLVAAVQAGGVTRVYKLNEVPAGAPYPYAVVGLGSPDKIARTGDGAAGDLDRATAQFFGRDVDGVLDIASKGDLDGARLSGRLVSREVSSLPYRDPDDSGVINITHVFRF
jgi:hypothetical protein